MKRIGILLGSIDCSKYLYETASELAKNDQIGLFYLINNYSASKQGVVQKLQFHLKTKGMLKFIDLVLFKIISVIEYQILSIFFHNAREHNQTYNIQEFTDNEILYLSPEFSTSGLVVRYPDEDVSKIRSLNLDLIIRGNAPGIFKGEIIHSSKDGIISFHHGDNRWNRGGPPGFWEVYLRKPSTGFILQILTEELDGGYVIFRGNIPTKRSYTENKVNLFSTSNPYLASIIIQYSTSNTLPSPEDKLPHGGSLLTVPSIIQSTSYVTKTIFLFFCIVINRLVFRKYERWGVAYVRAPWQEAILRKGNKIKNPPNRFFADPFVITKDGKTICFVEDYDYIQKKGCITAIEIINRKKYKILGTALDEPFHMSFPFLFEYHQELYMVPETTKSNSIRLYKCIEFPLKWEYQRNLLSGVKVVDSMIFEFDGKWWLLCTMNIGESDDYVSTLMAFYCTNPLTDDWVAHQSNPLVFDCNVARNGGILRIENNNVIRVRQKQGFNSYGQGLTLAKINKLTPSSFQEDEIGEITLGFFKRIKGCHHIDSEGKYTVYDYSRIESLK